MFLIIFGCIQTEDNASLESYFINVSKQSIILRGNNSEQILIFLSGKEDRVKVEAISSFGPLSRIEIKK